jgi:hypothetical protein
MAIDVLAHLLEAALGPIFLLFHVPELGAAVGDAGQLLDLALSGDVAAAVDGLLQGQYDVGTKTLASLVGSLLWIGVVGSLFGELGELGELGAVLELFG